MSVVLLALIGDRHPSQGADRAGHRRAHCIAHKGYWEIFLDLGSGIHLQAELRRGS